MLGLLVCTQVHAEWVLVWEDPESKMYYDDQSIRRVGDLVKVYQLSDYQIPSETYDYAKSVKVLTQYDCKNDTVAFLWIATHSGSMGIGKEIDSSFRPGKVRPIPPQSHWSDMIDIVCQTAKKSGRQK